MAKEWTPERRAAQSARIRALKPWEKSTGPKTKAGKKRAGQNAVKHGDRRKIVRQARAALRAQQEFLRLVSPLLRDGTIDAAFHAAQTNYKQKQDKTAG